MKTTVSLLALFLAVLFIGRFWNPLAPKPYTVTDTPVATTTVAETPKPVGETPAPVSNSYTAAEIAAHGNKTSCWTSINGNVYDVTSWIGKHPGGEAAILSLCGKDGSAAFTGQHGGQTRPETMLATFKIGVLVK